MSIIYDALKKLEQKAITETKPRPKEKIFKQQKIKLIAIYVLMACLGLAIGNFIFSRLAPPLPGGAKARPVTLAQEPLKAEIPPLQGTAHAAQAPPQETLPSPILVLNGIFFSQENGYALINNQIVKEGDDVDGAKVKKISMDEVELDALGSSIKLSYREK
ncbi:MAG: hypothetical protein Q8N85_05855 [Candidatus Omnitrophota bacterium]|nr:hypothetical protein [Candidatus Omnitrophota bacterium]